MARNPLRDYGNGIYDRTFQSAEFSDPDAMVAEDAQDDLRDPWRGLTVQKTCLGPNE